MNFLELLLMTLINLLGFNTTKPRADLHKKVGMMDRIEEFLLSHATFFLVVSLIILLILFVALMFAIVGVSATESGIVYNHLGDML